MVINLILSLVFLFIVIKSADFSIKFSSRLAKALHFPEFVVSFFIIAFISVLPEATIAIISAINQQPELGLGTLLGAKVMDLTLVLGIVTLFASGGIKVKSKLIEDNFFYLLLLIFPIVLGLDGYFSRPDGLILFLIGGMFYYKIYSQSVRFRKKFNGVKKHPFAKSLILLIISLAILVGGALLTVKFATNFAYDAKVPTFIIGVTILALGTCLPELIFSIKAVKNNKDELALGDILGTVITDATIILGTVAMICPFAYNKINFLTMSIAMFLSGIFVIVFMRTESSINKREGILLIIFYVIFLFSQFITNNFIL